MNFIFVLFISTRSVSLNSDFLKLINFIFILFILTHSVSLNSDFLILINVVFILNHLVKFVLLLPTINTDN